ncbi:hypothetical protein W04_0871 [Pseudoalteromonas sp. SW0106-04]|nr:hypothetical protein W04_0871 [Pseudoalteromonas sp. SW0106-04]
MAGDDSISTRQYDMPSGINLTLIACPAVLRTEFFVVTVFTL